MLVRSLVRPVVRPLVRSVTAARSGTSSQGSRVTALFVQAGIASDYYPASVLKNQVMLKKLRSDYPEFVVYTPLTPDGIDWHRWYCENRLNAGGAAAPGAGAPRMAKSTIAKLYASTVTATAPQNQTTGAQAQAATSTQGTAGGTHTGTWAASATINSVPDIRYSSVIGDKVVFPVTTAQRIALRALVNPSNGGIIAVVVKDSGGVEIAAGKYTVPLTGAERLINLKPQVTGQVFVPLADDLPLGNYSVELTVAASNPAGGRAYIGGIHAYGVTAPTAVGRTGTWWNTTLGSTTNVPMSYDPGSQVIYAFNGTKVALRHGVTTNVAKLDVRVYTAAGVEIAANKYQVVGNEIDPYAGASSIKETPVAAGLAKGNYFLVVKSKPTKNTSSTGYRAYDYGLIAYDEGAAGVLGVDQFDDQGVAADTYFGGNAMLIGFGNLEVAISNAAAGVAPASGDFSGGIHGHESAPTNFVLKVDSVALDFAAAAAGQTWVGTTADFACESKLLGAIDNVPFADVITAGRFTREGYLALAPNITVTMPVRFRDFYVLMLNVPSAAPDNIGAAGGFAFFAGSGDTVPVREFRNFTDGSNALGAQIESGLFFNDGYAVVAQQIDLAGINARFSAPMYAGSRPLSFVQERNDKTIKWYNRAFSGSDAGVDMPVGSLGASAKLYRAFKRGVAGAH